MVALSVLGGLAKGLASSVQQGQERAFRQKQFTAQNKLLEAQIKNAEARLVQNDRRLDQDRENQKITRATSLMNLRGQLQSTLGRPSTQVRPEFRAQIEQQVRDLDAQIGTLMQGDLPAQRSASEDRIAPYRSGTEASSPQAAASGGSGQQQAQPQPQVAGIPEQLQEQEAEIIRSLNPAQRAVFLGGVDDRYLSEDGETLVFGTQDEADSVERYIRDDLQLPMPKYTVEENERERRVESSVNEMNALSQIEGAMFVEDAPARQKMEKAGFEFDDDNRVESLPDDPRLALSTALPILMQLHDTEGGAGAALKWFRENILAHIEEDPEKFNQVFDQIQPGGGGPKISVPNRFKLDRGTYELLNAMLDQPQHLVTTSGGEFRPDKYDVDWMSKNAAHDLDRAITSANPYVSLADGSDRFSDGWRSIPERIGHMFPGTIDQDDPESPRNRAATLYDLEKHQPRIFAQMKQGLEAARDSIVQEVEALQSAGGRVDPDMAVRLKMRIRRFYNRDSKKYQRIYEFDLFQDEIESYIDRNTVDVEADRKELQEVERMLEDEFGPGLPGDDYFEKEAARERQGDGQGFVDIRNPAIDALIESRKKLRERIDG